MTSRRGFLAASLAAGAAQSAGVGSIVSTTSGKVRGGVRDGVSFFKGIPYGAPTETARFLPPVKPRAWSGIRDAVELGQKAPQFPSQSIPEFAALRPANEPMGEDCLCLSVWTGAIGERRQRPVMVWLHGGGFATASGGWELYDGTALAGKHEVVVVTLNHRLNVFGYLYLAELGAAKYADSGNAGMLDIVAALEWVRDNIGAFGGDPRNVTIFGESGGGEKVGVLMAMPAAKGLFHRAIIQSAAALRESPLNRAAQVAGSFVAKVGVKVDELAGVPMQRLLDAMRATPGAGSGPVVDGRSLANDPFDPVAPAVSGDVPLLIGSNATETTFFPNTPLEDMNDAALHAHVKPVARGRDADADQLIAAYKNAQPGAANIDVFLAMASDAWMRMNVITQAERKAALGKAPVYMYYFSWRTPVRGGRLRSPHSLEIAFAFDHVDLAQSMTGSGRDRYALAEKMSGAWTAFARTGNPGWPAFDVERRATMVFDNECRVVNDPGGGERRAMMALRARQTAG